MIFDSTTYQVPLSGVNDINIPTKISIGNLGVSSQKYSLRGFRIYPNTIGDANFYNEQNQLRQHPYKYDH